MEKNSDIGVLPFVRKKVLTAYTRFGFVLYTS